MFAVGNVLMGLAKALDVFLEIYMYILFGRAIVSWVNADPRNVIVQFLVRATEPPRRLIWKMLPRSMREFPLDMAFLVLVGLIVFARFAVVQTVFDIGARMRPPAAPVLY